MTAEEVLALWREGRLYVEVKEAIETDAEMLARCQREALAYVQRAEVFASPKWKPYIRRLWQSIVRTDVLASGLVMKQKRQMNRYYVTGIIFNLQTLGAYRPTGEVSQLKLHLTMEDVKEKNGIFKNWNRYAINVTQRKKLQALMKDLLASLK